MRKRQEVRIPKLLDCLSEFRVAVDVKLIDLTTAPFDEAGANILIPNIWVGCQDKRNIGNLDVSTLGGLGRFSRLTLFLDDEIWIGRLKLDIPQMLS